MSGTIDALPGHARESGSTSPSSAHLPDGCDFDLLEHVGQLFDVTQDLLCVLGFDGAIKYLNASWEQVLGYSREELMANPFPERVHPDDLEATVADIRKVQAGIPTKAFENRIRCKDGSYKWFSWASTASATRQWYYVSGRDITETKDSQASVLRLAHALENSSEMICMSDDAARAIFANQALLDVSGYTKDEILGKSLNDTLLSAANPPALAEEIQNAMQRDGKWIGECLQKRKLAPDLPVSLSLGLIKDKNGNCTGAYGISYDITERKRAERELGEHDAFLNSLINACPVGIVVIDVDSRVQLCNPAFENVFRYKESEIIGRPLYDLLTTPAIRSDVNTNRRRFSEETVTCIATRRARSDGSLVDVEGYFVPLGPRDKPDGALVLYEDVTERKSIEQRLHQAQKMEAVGQLAGGIAHDFNNLLMVILGYSSALEGRPDIGTEAQAKLKEIGNAARRAASLTRQLLAFSRRQVLEPRVLSLNAVVEDVKKMLARLISEDIALVIDLDPELRHIKADQSQMEQVIVNLAVNARDAMPGGGVLTIRTANVDVTESDAHWSEQIPPGAYVALTVSDIGTGMDEETQARAFEPFFTTKELSKGTGLGLSTVYGAVKQSGGFISLRSEPGQGTKFEIYFPRVQELAEAAPKAVAPGVPSRGSETILLVEDDEALRELILSALTGAGYTVLEAANGTEGLLIAKKRDGAIDLVLTDVVMPVMSGPKMATRISALFPEIPILYMSGYSESANGYQEILSRSPLLQKPFELATLTREVRAMLNRRRASSNDPVASQIAEH